MPRIATAKVVRRTGGRDRKDNPDGMGNCPGGRWSATPADSCRAALARGLDSPHAISASRHLRRFRTGVLRHRARGCRLGSLSRLSGYKSPAEIFAQLEIGRVWVFLAAVVVGETTEIKLPKARSRPSACAAGIHRRPPSADARPGFRLSTRRSLPAERTPLHPGDRA